VVNFSSTPFDDAKDVISSMDAIFVVSSLLLLAVEDNDDDDDGTLPIGRR